MKMAKRLCALMVAFLMVVTVTVVPASAATSVFYHFPLVTESMGNSYMAAAVAVQKFLILYNGSYATRIIASGGTDGFFGSTSAAVTKLFQAGHGLTNDGKVGSNTWLKFESIMGKEESIEPSFTLYYLNGNSVYSYDQKIIGFPVSSGYCAYDQDGGYTVPFYYP